MIHIYIERERKREPRTQICTRTEMTTMKEAVESVTFVLRFRAGPKDGALQCTHSRE